MAANADTVNKIVTYLSIKKIIAQNWLTQSARQQQHRMVTHADPSIINFRVVYFDLSFLLKGMYIPL